MRRSPLPSSPAQYLRFFPSCFAPSIARIEACADILPTGRNQALVRRLEKGLDWASIVAGAMGAVALILLSIFDTARYPSLHRLFLFLFILGVVLSALFTTLEYRRLGKVFIERSFLKISYRVKQAIVVLEVCL